MKEVNLSLTLDQTNHILETLAQQPYQQVHALIAHIQQTAQEQLQAVPESTTVQNGVLEEELST